MPCLRALHVFLWSLFLTPALAFAQATEPMTPTEPTQVTRWGMGWVWWAVLGVILVALVAWGLSQDRRRQGPPLAH